MTPTVSEIPLTAQSQTLQIGLGGTTYQLTVAWRASGPTQMPVPDDVDTAGAWVIDVADAEGSPILRGMPLVTGCDLLAQYGYLNFGGALVVQTDHDVDAVPTWGNLGSEAHLYFVVV